MSIVVVQRPALALGGVPSSAPNPLFSNVSFVTDWEGTDEGTDAVDFSNNKHTITYVANASLEADQKKFGSTSLSLDGTGDWITLPDNTVFEFGTGEFTIEGWFNVSVKTKAGLITKWVGSGNLRSWMLRYDDTDNKLEFWRSTDGTDNTELFGAVQVLTIGQWYHIAVDKDGSDVLRMYVDGVMIASVTDANTFSDVSTVVKVGGYNTAFSFNGFVDGVRITKGEAIYASDDGFVVPTTSFPYEFDYLTGTAVNSNSSSSYCSKGTLFDAARDFTMTHVKFWSETAGASGELVVALYTGTGTIDSILGRVSYSGTPNGGIVVEELPSPIEISDGDAFMVAVQRTDGISTTSGEVSFGTIIDYEAIVDQSFATLKASNSGFRRADLDLQAGDTNSSPAGTPWSIYFEGNGLT